MPEFDALLSGGGEMGERIRAHDWAATPLGCRRDWPKSLKIALNICLHSNFPMAIYWGSDLRLLYNDAWSFIPGPRHPDVLGRPAREVWPDIWHIIEPQFRLVVETSESFITQDQYLPMQRFGRIEETYWDYSFSPIAGEDGAVIGILNQGQDRTRRVLGQRRMTLIMELNDRLRLIDNRSDIIATALQLIGTLLDVGRAGFCEVDASQHAIQIQPCWIRDSMPDLAGKLPIGELGSDIYETLSAGRIFQIEDIRTDPRFTDSAGAGWYADTDVRSSFIVPVTNAGHFAAALFVDDSRPRSWTDHESSLLRTVAHRIFQELARARAEMALRASEERHRLIFEQANDIIFTTNLDHVITSCNPAAAASFEMKPEELIGRSVREFLTPEAYAQSLRMLQQKLDHGGTTRHDVELVVSPGRIRRWEINSGMQLNSDGRTIGLNIIARDVTEQRAFGERQQLLINELNHRVKNMLALVQGLALQSFKSERRPGEGYASFQNRLASLAAAHDLLTRDQWEGVTLGELVAEATRVHTEADADRRIHAVGPNVLVTPKAAIALVLAFHELGTNAAKYGSLSVPKGRVDIHWTVGDGRLRIEWRETGGPRVSAPVRQGFGLRMIERALASDLSGLATVTFAPDGLVCFIDAPIPESST